LVRTYSVPPGAWWAGDDRWFPSDFEPQPGNRLTPLVDGEEVMHAMYDAMEHARESIYLTAWFITPGMRMVRPSDDADEPAAGRGGPRSLLNLLASKADDVDVRVLLWPGASVGKLSRRLVKENLRHLADAHPRILARQDTHEHFAHCHHQKTLVVDGRVAFVGGIDVTSFDADRWDVRRHTYRLSRNWHDVHWQIEGPCVADVATNFAQRWNEVAPDRPVQAAPRPEPLADGAVAQVQRTIPRRIYAFAPDGIYGIVHAHVRAIARAERFIYLESQYLWSPEVTDALCDALRRGRATGLRVAIVLPAHPNVGKADSDRHVQRLRQADAGHGMFQAYTLYTCGWDDPAQRMQYRPIYVHAKTAIVDDTWATAGSANLNGRGMATDSEINLSTTDTAAIRRLRLRLWAEHLGSSEEELADDDPVMLLDQRFPAVAREQLTIVTSRSGPLTAGLYPYPFGHVAADFGPGEIESALLDR
jgi:phosphatidylserine/phosphatidylglycerophosphate/cardiolipin synthase-like enzyme